MSPHKRARAGREIWDCTGMVKLREMAKMSRVSKLLGAASTVVVLAAPANAQSFDIRNLFSSNPITGSVPPQQPQVAAPAQGASEWSGESGSSGHPAMQADAI